MVLDKYNGPNHIVGLSDELHVLSNHASGNPRIRVLLDTGSEENHIKGQRYRTESNREINHDAPPGMTLAGPHLTNCEVDLFDVVLPEFSETRRIAKMTCKLFDVPCNYDLILGQNDTAQARATI